MADFLDSNEPSLFSDEEEFSLHSTETARFLGRMSQATSEVLQGIATPSDPSQFEGAVTTKEAEENVRELFVDSEIQVLNTQADALATEAIVNRASPEDIEAILSVGKVTEEQKKELKTSVLERNAAKWLVDQGLASPERAASIIQDELVDGKDTDQRQEFVTTLLRLNTIRQRIADKFENSSFSEKALDFATMAIVPGHSTLANAKVFGRGVETLGDSILKFSQDFWSAPLAERLKILDEFEKNLEDNTVVSSNMFTAMEQIEDLLAFKSEDTKFRTMIEVIDASILLKPLSMLIRGARSISGASRLAGAKDVSVSRSVTLRDTERATNTGPRAEREGFVGPIKDTEKELKGGPVVEGVSRVVDDDELVNNILPSSHAPDTPIEKPVGPVNNALDIVDLDAIYRSTLPALIEQAERSGVKLGADDITPVGLLSLLKGVVVPNVLTPAEQSAANIAAVREILKQFDLHPEMRAIVDPEKLTANAVSNKAYPLYDVEIDEVGGIRTVHVYLGTGDDKLKGFTSAEAAEAGAKRMGLEKGFFEISNRSGEHFVRVSRNPGTTQFIRPIKDGDIPGVLPVIGKYVQGSKTTQDLNSLLGARLATNASSALNRGIMPTVQKISSLPKAARETHNNLMLHVQEREKWLTSEQVREWYVDNYQRAPSQKEVDAYDAERTLHAFDYIIRNNATRQSLIGASYQEVLIKGYHKSPVVGKVVATTSVDTRSTRIFDAVEGKELRLDSRKELDDILKRSDDTVLIKLLKEESELGSYVVTTRDGFNIKALRANILNRFDGPHRIYAGDGDPRFRMIKQQKIRNIRGRETLVNPRTHFAILGTKEAQEFADGYNKALTAFVQARATKNSTTKALASDIISKNTRFSSYEEMAKAVDEGRMELSPFEVLKDGELPKHRADELAGTKAIDPDFANLPDDIQSLVETGRLFDSKRGPRLYHPKEGMATLMSPRDITSRAISNARTTQAMGNFRIRQIDRWVKSFGKFTVGFDGTRPSIDTFMYGKFDSSPRAKFQLPPALLRSAEAQRMSIKRFLGEKSVIDESISRYRNELIDLMDGNVNKNVTDRVANITSHNFFASARGMAFKAYLGMMDASQLIIQQSMLPGLMAAAPIEGPKMLALYAPIRFALLNPEHTSKFGKMFQSLTGVDAATMELLVADIRRSGIDIIDSNIAEIDNMPNAGNLKTLGASRLTKTTDAMSIFFNEAEKANQVIGFGIAWLQNFKATGKGLTTPEEFAAVGLRGDAFAGNMKKDGKAFWQDGILGVPGQFMAHPSRVTEILVAPNRGGFTKAERARYYTGLALTYGPLLGGGSGFIAYMAAQYEAATGEAPDENVMNALRGGIVQMLFPETDISRLQPLGNDIFLADIFDMDGGINIHGLAGPSGNIANRFYNATWGSYKLWSLMRGKIRFEDTPEAVLDLGTDMLKVLSSYSRAEKAVVAWQYKKLYSGSGRLLQEDLDRFDAVLLGLGFPPIESSRAFESSIDFKAYRKVVFKDAVETAVFMRKEMNAKEGSAEQKNNRAYAQHIIDKNLDDPLTADGGEMFSRELDKQLRKQGAYNTQNFERMQKTWPTVANRLIRD